MAVSDIVALHGFMGVGADFEPFTEACGLDMGTPDLIGHGAFQCADPTEYSLDAQLEHWFARIPTGSILMGYSMGGRLALQFACRYPQHLSGLVLIGATPGIKEPEQRVKRQQWDQLQADRIRELGVEGFYNAWQQLPIIATQQRIESSIRHQMKINRFAQSIEGLTNSMIHFGTGTMRDCWDELSNLRLPILLMTGEEDSKYRTLASQMLARLPDGFAELQVILGAGHCAHLEKMTDSAAVLKQWLYTVDERHVEE